MTREPGPLSLTMPSAPQPGGVEIAMIVSLSMNSQPILCETGIMLNSHGTASSFFRSLARYRGV